MDEGMNPIPVKFKIPHDYEREFRLTLPKSRHLLVCNRHGLFQESSGKIISPKELCQMLDWIYDSIMEIRDELGLNENQC